MGLLQKYAEISIDELYQAYIDLDKKNHPYEAIELRNEIEHRKAHGEMPSSPYDRYVHDIDAALKEPELADLPALPLQFKGEAREYFRIWIVNLCLTLLTLGIFSAWAKVRKKRYFYSHTTVGGTAFQYLGQPVPILKGRLVAVAGFGLYYISSHFVVSWLPYVLAAGLVAAPWVLVRSAAFNARYSAFRNMTFDFGGEYWDAAKVLYAWGIVPAFVIGLMFKGFGRPYITVILSLAFTLSFPFLICRIKRFMVEYMSYGGKKGLFSARGGQFFSIYFASGLIIMAFVVPTSFIVGILLISAKKTVIVGYLAALPMYAGYVLGYAYVRSKSTNLVWNNTKIGPLRFQSTLQFKELAALYLTNALGIIASCGLMVPWAVIRTRKYRIDHLTLFQKGILAEFAGRERRSAAAIGAETLDIFDWDLSL